MSVELIGARVAEIQQQIAAVTGQATAPSTSFASQLADAQSGTGAATSTAATPATLGGGAATQYDAQITAAATKYGIDPALLKGLIRQESNFNASAQSGAGAQGLTQLMPGTASSLGVDPSDPAQAIEGGAKYLKQQLDRFGGDPSKALAAYNAGPGAVAKYGGVPPYAETQNYVQKVLGYAAEYEGTAATTAATTSAVPVTTTPVSAASLLSSTDDGSTDDTSSSGALDYSTV
ncbi:lytic transglycosylase domain-containing protein [Baekduia sp.]|jgi:soluble lytic murein transglycosylase-like protein|uniref:lytic transglycosylase domain-containing protein n=1 Tax=Baekduia sp. TaxID=2600305 RepID=UPI002E040213|nr:lytic transglycosylase domain-containing protein [Baekduia sp.]